MEEEPFKKKRKDLRFNADDFRPFVHCYKIGPKEQDIYDDKSDLMVKFEKIDHVFRVKESIFR